MDGSNSRKGIVVPRPCCDPNADSDVVDFRICIVSWEGTFGLAVVRLKETCVDMDEALPLHGFDALGPGCDTNEDSDSVDLRTCLSAWDGA